MKTFALGIALGASLVSTAAFAGEQRPTYIAFKAPVASPANMVSMAPAGPVVSKRNGVIGKIPLFVPLVGGVTILGFIAAFSTGGGGNNGSPN